MGNKCSKKGRGKCSRRTQKGGATYAINEAPPIVTSGGVNLATVSQIDPHCGWTLRPPPQLGGRRRTQRGGGCGCGSVSGSSVSSSRMVGGAQRGGSGNGTSRMVGGGAGTGGHSFSLTNELGKVYASLPVGACPVQAGGSAPIGSDAALREIVSYPSGYALGHPFSTRNESAHFLEPVRYDRSCMGGGSRSSRRNRKQKNRRNRK